MNDLKSENEKPKSKIKELYEYQIDPEFVENKLLELEDPLREKCPNTEFFLVRIVLYLD